MLHHLAPAALTAALTLATAMTTLAITPQPYPKAPSDNTVDTYFDFTLADPYRPLENDTAAATLKWVEAENLVTNNYLSQIPFRDKVRNRLTALANYPKQGRPWLGHDGRYYFSLNDGLQNQSVIYRKATLDGTPELFLDPNKLSDDGTVALTGLFQSPDGKYTAYTISRSGSDWTEIYLLDTATGELLPDHIEWAKFTGAAWDGDGFYYSAYDMPEAGMEFSNSNENHRIYYHKVGTPQSQDILAYSDPEHPFHFHSVDIPDGTRWLVVMTGGEGVGDGVMAKNLADPNAQWIVVEPSQDYTNAVVDIRDNKMLLLTNYGAPKSRLVMVDLENPQRENWIDVIPELKGLMDGVSVAGKDHLLVMEQRDALDHMLIYSRDGNFVKEIKTDIIGDIGADSDYRNDDIFFTVASFNTPGNQYLYNIASDTQRLLGSTKLAGFNPDDYVTEQVFYTSTDGTKVPMFLTYKKGLKRDGSNPVYLYGYGGFNISLPPSFSPYRLIWLENGGIYAQANLRGGSEYGEEWHQGGTKLNKLNVFNDFISAAEYMINEGWTKPELLAIEGASNGGLLVGATTNLRPDLFKVAIPRVGVMDMMRYHLFTIGWNWASDYGTSADSPEMAAYLRAYSPAHNIRSGVKYPAILVTTADHDDRVVPAHSFKYAAALQAADTGDAPKLIRIDSKAGHGAGKPISKVIDEYADIYSFIFENIGITPKE